MRWAIFLSIFKFKHILTTHFNSTMRITVLLAICFLTGNITGVTGQQLEKGIYQRKVSLRLTPVRTDTLRYLEVKDSNALKLTIELLEPSNYPLSIVKKPVMDPFFDLLQNYETQIDDCRQLENAFKTLDNIQQSKIRELVKLDSLQKERIKNYQYLVEEMRTTNINLSKQFNESVDIARKAYKAKVIKSVWAGVLGGAVGFSVAGLIALVK